MVKRKRASNPAMSTRSYTDSVNDHEGGEFAMSDLTHDRLWQLSKLIGQTCPMNPHQYTDHRCATCTTDAVLGRLVALSRGMSVADVFAKFGKLALTEATRCVGMDRGPWSVLRNERRQCIHGPVALSPYVIQLPSVFVPGTTELTCCECAVMSGRIVPARLSGLSSAQPSDAPGSETYVIPSPTCPFDRFVAYDVYSPGYDRRGVKLDPAPTLKVCVHGWALERVATVGTMATSQAIACQRIAVLVCPCNRRRYTEHRCGGCGAVGARMHELMTEGETRQLPAETIMGLFSEDVLREEARVRHE
jgi:hypothetical protein